MKFSVSTIKWFGYYKRIFVYKTMELMRHMFRLAVAILLAFAAGVQAQLVTYPEGLATGMPHNDDYTVRVRVPVGAVGRYKISHSGKIYLQSHLPLLTQDLAYVCGDKRAAVYRFISKVQQCKLDGDKLMFYSSDDSLIFYRKK